MNYFFFFLSKISYSRIFFFFFWFFFFFLLLRTLTRDETTVDSMSSQKEEVQKSAGFDVGAHAAQSTHSVCLFRVFFVHFVYLLGRFSDVNIGYKPPPPPLQACIIHKHGHFFVFSPLCHILCHDFLLFSMLLYFFFIFTHISL